MNKKQKNTCLIILCVLGLICFTEACSHGREELITACPCEGNEIKQTLKIKIKQKDRQDKVTVYSKINREEETAVMEGIGPLGRHVFTLNIRGNSYDLQDRINDKNYSGNIEEFDIMPLNRELIFKKLDINQPQPIVIKDERRGTEAEITVLKQENGEKRSEFDTGD